MSIELSQAAFLLHSRPYRENQLILHFITESAGKISALTYCSHKANKSAKKALLQPFTPLKIFLKGKGSLKQLSRVEPLEKSYQLQERFLYSGFYVNEILYRLLEDNVVCDGLFYHYQQTLIALNKQEALEPTLRYFEMTLLEDLGLSFDFSPVIDEQSNARTINFNYIPEQGFVAAIPKSKYPIYNKMHLLAIAQQELSPDVLKTFKRLMRQIFDNLLGTTQLNSRKLFLTKDFSQ